MIKMLTPKAKINEYVSSRINKMHNLILRQLCIAGEECVNRARITEQKGRDFTDQTGNLRSSIGYVVAYNGEIVRISSFDVIREGYEGSREGKAFAERLVSLYPSGYVLIVVAGKNYAKYVSAKGYDVLDSAELLAQKIVPDLLNQIGL